MPNQPSALSFTQSIRLRRAAPGLWLPNREAALNWLALGLLLAAWNAVDGDAPANEPRPAALKGYATISARAAQHQVTRL